MTTPDFEVAAAHAVATAKNPDWRNRGSLTIERTLTVKRQATDGRTYREVERGPVHVAAVRFEVPHQSYPGASLFSGFYLAIDDATGATVSRPIIGAFDVVTADNRPFQWAANELNRRFCPACNALDSVTSKQRRRGPECVEVTHRCTKCKWTESDVVD